MVTLNSVTHLFILPSPHEAPHLSSFLEVGLFTAPSQEPRPSQLVAKSVFTRASSFKGFPLSSSLQGWVQGEEETPVV